MDTIAGNHLMPTDFSNQDLKNMSFTNDNLVQANFSNCDLRGTDFSAADLTGADFTKAKTGITTSNTVWIFLGSLVVSLLSGYVAMLSGTTLHTLSDSADKNLRAAGIATVVVIVLFVLFSMWKGVGNAVRSLVTPVLVLAIAIGIINYASGLGTGQGMLYLILSVMLVVVMFVVGTIARATAGSLSANILFVIVALSGGIFGRSVGGGIGTVILAISCVVISKRALKGAEGFGALRKIAHFITASFGTSFRRARLEKANFSGAELRNSDFTNADVSDVRWGDRKKINCIE